MKKACIFVDGENFRHSLKSLFQTGAYNYRKGEYLPDTDWHKFFMNIAGGFDCELLRVYWYVVEHLDCRPYKIPQAWADKERVLRKWYHERIQKCDSEAAKHLLLKDLEKELDGKRDRIEKRAKGWREIQSAIENRNDQIEFRRSGSISYELATQEFGTEKGVDTQLATDMIVLSNIYDVAIIISGDADYLPPVSAVKRMGKLVYAVSFLTLDGRQLPGGARRLNNAVDSRKELKFEEVRTQLSIETLPQPELDLVAPPGTPKPAKSARVS
jgi:uncharacterized LabA/DUF88 family protein